VRHGIDGAGELGLTCAAVPARMPGARVQVGRRGEERCGTPQCAAVQPAITEAGGRPGLSRGKLDMKSQFSSSQRRGGRTWRPE
jgi:hypothetical protein